MPLGVLSSPVDVMSNVALLPPRAKRFSYETESLIVASSPSESSAAYAEINAANDASIVSDFLIFIPL